MRCRLHVTKTMLCLFLLLSPLVSRAEISPSIDSEALEILKTMNDYLLSQQAVSFRAIENEDEVLDNGQKIMSSREIHFEMLRPNKFHVKREDAEGVLEMFYDGTSFTLFRKNVNFFTTVAAPPTINEAFAELENKRNIQVVAQDLLRDDSYYFLQASSAIPSRTQKSGKYHFSFIETCNYPYAKHLNVSCKVA